jgi:ferredoxin/flavodoxin---NADP+ reductase
MSNLFSAQVLSVHHWTDTLFSFTVTRDPGFRYQSGQFAMIGLEVDGRPLMRAYSMVSPHYEETLEFLSIKVADGPLTSRLQSIKPGDSILVGRKASGTLLVQNLIPGKRLYLLGTGTGLAPFMSIVQDPEVYEHFAKVILVHGCRQVRELAYQERLSKDLHEHEYLGDMVSAQLAYFPTVTREPFKNQGRIPSLIRSEAFFEQLGMPMPDLDGDRFMLCGSPAMLKETQAVLEEMGFTEGNMSTPGHYVIERAFVEK